MQSGFFNSQPGFQDPSDPTTIFTTQPEIFNPNKNFIGNNVYID